MSCGQMALREVFDTKEENAGVKTSKNEAVEVFWQTPVFVGGF